MAGTCIVLPALGGIPEEWGERRDPVFQFVNAVLDQVVTNQSHVAAVSGEVRDMNMQENKCRK